MKPIITSPVTAVTDNNGVQYVSGYQLIAAMRKVANHYLQQAVDLQQACNDDPDQAQLMEMTLLMGAHGGLLKIVEALQAGLIEQAEEFTLEW